MLSHQPKIVESNTELPTGVDTAIIGGGIAGVTTALELVEQGQTVALFEKGILAGEQSGRNWGWCRQMGRDAREIPLSNISLDLWRKMDARTGEKTGFVECGIAYLCATDEQFETRRQWFENQAVPHELSTRILSSREANAISGGSLIPWVGGLMTSDDGRAEPQLAVPAIASAVLKHGGTIHQQCAVRTIELEAGRVSSVVTEKGEVRCKNVVLAAGAWSHRFLRNMSIRLPQLTVRNSAMRTASVEVDLPHSIAGGGLAFRKRLDGGFTVADDSYNTVDIIPDSFRYFGDFLPTLKTDWRDFKFRFGRRFFEEAGWPTSWAADDVTIFEKVRQIDVKPDKALLNAAEKILRKRHPAFKNVPIVERWAGGIDVVPDVVPVISHLPDIEGVFVATGFSGHGFGLGPGAGKLMAQLVLGDETCVDPNPFRFDRF